MVGNIVARSRDPAGHIVAPLSYLRNWLGVLPQWASDTNTDVAGNKGQQFNHPSFSWPPVVVLPHLFLVYPPCGWS
jgi:hypothetical protein